MDMLSALIEIAKSVALPLGVALLTAQVTLRAGRQQIRAQLAERNENRDRERQKQQEDNAATAHSLRRDTLESISDCIDQYISDFRSGNRPTTDAVIRSFFRLASRCSAEHLADICREYVEDSQRALDPVHTVEAMLDIRRRLVGWHIGHLTREDAQRLIQEGHRDIVRHIELLDPVVP
jgi:hypothetical protein